MNTILLSDLVLSRDAIRAAWLESVQEDARLREMAPRVATALDELLEAFARGRGNDEPLAPPESRGPCPENPVVRFYLAGEKALLRAALKLERLDPALAHSQPGIDLTELYLILRRTARSQAKRLCAGCAHCLNPLHSHKRGAQPHAPHVPHAHDRPHAEAEDDLIGPFVNAIEPA